MNRSTFLPLFALALAAAPLTAALASEAQPPENAPAAAASSAKRQDAPPANGNGNDDGGTRCLSADERSELREQVRLAAEEEHKKDTASSAQEGKEP